MPDSPIHEPRDVAVAGYAPLAFPDGDWSWFVDRCRDLGLTPPDAARRTVLERLHGHLVGVNAWCNLTRINGPADYLRLHVLDALLPLSAADLGGLPAGTRCLDLGSGAGYPGLVLALWRPDWQWTLVERRQRKAAFLVAAAGLLPGLAVTVQAHDVRELRALAPHLAGGMALITARAVGAADTLIALAAPLLAPGGRLLLYKGPAFAADEQAAARHAAMQAGLSVGPRLEFSLAVGLAPRIVAVYRRGGHPA